MPLHSSPGDRTRLHLKKERERERKKERKKGRKKERREEKRREEKEKRKRERKKRKEYRLTVNWYQYKGALQKSYLKMWKRLWNWVTGRG